MSEPNAPDTRVMTRVEVAQELEGLPAKREAELDAIDTDRATLRREVIGRYGERTSLLKRYLPLAPTTASDGENRD